MPNQKCVYVTLDFYVTQKVQPKSQSNFASESHWRTYSMQQSKLLNSVHHMDLNKNIILFTYQISFYTL